MHKKTKIIANIKRIQDSLDQNIDAIKKNNEASKNLVDLRQENENLLNIVDAFSEDLIEKKGDNLLKVEKSRYNYLQAHIQNIPIISASVFSTGTGLTTFSCVEALDIIKKDPEYSAYYNDVIQQYESSQSGQERINIIKSMLDNISIVLSKQYMETINLYKQYQINLIDDASFANSLRNLIYKLQGELKDIINKKFNLSEKKFKWNFLCNYLAKNGKGSVEHKQLINMKTKYDDIIDILSNISKNRNNQTKAHITIIYSEIIDFIYSVLNLISFD